MSTRRISFVVCLIVSIVCLIVEYAITGQWIGVVAAIITGLTWLPAWKYPDSGLPSLCLVISVCLAAAGQLNDSSPLLMICSSGLALAVWDLTFLNDALGSSSSELQTKQYERKHIKSLVLALVCGLLAAFIGHWLKFQIPFLAMMLFITLAMFGFVRFWSTIKKRIQRMPS